MSNRMFLTLPSNSSLMYYPNNTLANFKTQLLNKINLNHAGDWEIGLAEIQYPQNWHTPAPGNDEYEITVCPRTPDESKIQGLRDDEIEFLHCVRRTVGPFPKQDTLPKGYYRSIPDIIEVLNRKYGTRYAKFGWVPFENRVKVLIKKDKAVLLSPRFAKILGLRRALLGKKGEEKVYIGESVNPFPPDIKNMYVYCNLAQHRVVGDVEAPLLRIIPIKGRHQEFITHVCEDVHFVPAIGGENSMVEIDIRDDLGEPIPFEEGKLVVVVELRKRKPFLY